MKPEIERAMRDLPNEADLHGCGGGLTQSEKVRSSAAWKYLPNAQVEAR
jgi:hypothetical protein